MGGDHKCPLCSATFTRPQHVGRHLRAHTGDRPYACKECPLRFARSDLLSRHVNKAHPKPNGQVPDKNEKKSRRKSSANSTSSNVQAGRPPMPIQPPPMGLNHGVAGVSAQRPSQPEPTPYQAQRMYPNHPLLQQNNNAWIPRMDMNGDPNAMAFGPTGGIPDGKGGLLDPSLAFMPQYGMHLQGVPGQENHLYNVGPGGFMTMQGNMGYEIPVKKRACDQCNHSKVRCDFAEPCARCAHRSIQCTYAKPQKARSAAYTMATSQTNVTQSPPSGPESTGALAVPNTSTWDAKMAATQQFTHASALAQMQQSPTQNGLELTPSLTNSTSPTASSEGALGSTAGSNGSGWMINAAAPSGSGLDLQLNGYGGNAFQDSQSFDQASVSSSLTDNSGIHWRGPFGGSAVDDDDLSSSASVADPKEMEHERRPSSTSAVWASSFDQLKLDDQSFNVDPAAMNDFQFHSPQRNGSLPSDAPPSFSRQQSGNEFWKLFLDPMALATPDRMNDGEQFVTVETPRGLSKSNSMPDLTTPTTATATMASFPQMKDGQVLPHPQSNNRPKPVDDEAMLKWKDHIQQRHASFSMHLGPKSNGLAPRELTNPSFASSRLHRPLANPLLMCTSLEQTLAPERMPSFGTPTPGYDAAGPFGRAPSKLPHSHLAERPTYKRQASQTLTQDTQKRATFMSPVNDEGSSSAASSRRSSEGLQQPLMPVQVQLPHRRSVPFTTPFQPIPTVTDPQRAA